MTLTTSLMQWSITIPVLTGCTVPPFTNKVPHNFHMTLTTSLMQWSITILVLTGCTAPPFTNKVPHNVHMTISTSLMQWSITMLVPTLWITVVLLHQPPGHVQPAMAAGEAKESCTPGPPSVISNACWVPDSRQQPLDFVYISPLTSAYYLLRSHYIKFTALRCIPGMHPGGEREEPHVHNSNELL